MTSALLTPHSLSVRLAPSVPATSVTDVDLNDLRSRGDRLLSDLAFVLHLSRKVEQEEIAEEDTALAVV